MLNNYRTSERERSKTLLVVEGSHEKKLLFFSLLKAFPEINIKRDNIWVYRTNIYMLYDQLIKEYSEPLEQVDIDLPYVLSRNADNKPTQYKRDYTNIFLVFDYERHDPNFSEYKINRLLSLFDNVTDVGQLYINYPMVESYMDFSCVPDAAFYQKKAWVIQRGNEYKNLVKDSPVLKLVELEHRIENILKEKYPGVSNSKIHNCVDLLLNESNSFSFDVIKEDIRSSVGDNDSLNQVSHLIADIIEKAFFYYNWGYVKNLRWMFTHIIFQNLVKAEMIENDTILSMSEAEEKGITDYNIIELTDLRNAFSSKSVLGVQNKSANHHMNPYIWVLNTSVFLVSDYKISLLDLTKANQ